MLSGNDFIPRTHQPLNYMAVFAAMCTLPPIGQRLLTIPGIGPITASLLAAEMGDGKQYGCSRDFAASIGVVPRQYSTGGRTNLLGISKRGDKNIRRLLVQCARTIMLRLDKRNDQLGLWIRTMLTRRHSNVVACALATS